MMSSVRGGFGRPWKDIARRREAFLHARESIRSSDDEFANAVFVRPSLAEQRIAAILRRIIAAHCGVPAEAILPYDNVADLELLMGSASFIGWLLDPYHGRYDAWSVHFALERDLREITGKKLVLRKAHMSALHFLSGKGVVAAHEPGTLANWLRRVCAAVIEELSHQGLLL